MQKSIAERRYKEIVSTPMEGTAYEKATQMIEKMKTVVPQGKSKNLNDQLLDLINEIDKRKTADKRMSYGIPKLDLKTNGIHKENLVIVSGRPGVGKSAFALQVANHVLNHGYKVLFVSLEMGESELLERLIMHLSDIDGNAMKTGNLSKGEWNQTSVAMDKISKYKLDINTRVRNTGQLRVEIARTQPDLVIVDQLGLLREDERHNSRREEITAITRKLKLMAMDFGIPVIALAQINRDASENYPTLANLKESGSIEEDANVVIMLHGMTKEQCDKTNMPYHDYDSGRKTILIMLAKHRAGEVGNIPSVYIGRKYKFMEIQT
jgi:replicative DNA helicase